MVVRRSFEFSHSRITFFSYTIEMSGLIRKLLVFTALTLPLAVVPARGQSIGYGVRGGVPLSDFVKAESKTGALTR